MNEEKELIPEPSLDQKLQWFKEWRVKVLKEIDEYTEEKDKLLTAYKKQKSMYDSWLAVKLKKIKKFDIFVTNRKKVLIDIDRELGTLSSTSQQISSTDSNSSGSLNP